VKINRKTAILAAIIILVVAGLIFYYIVALRTNDKTGAPKSEAVGARVPSKEEISPITEAYTEYLKGVKADKQPAALKAFQASTSKALAARLAQEKKGADPILCAQNVPTGLSFSQPLIMGDTTLVTVTAKFADGKQLITVTADTKTKQITDIVCVEAHRPTADPTKPKGES
jgi:hypothetical protein